MEELKICAHCAGMKTEWRNGKCILSSKLC